jgi:hypothetical protein
MLRLALCVLGGQVVNGQFSGFGDLINSLRSMVPAVSNLPIPPEPSAIIDMIGDFLERPSMPDDLVFPQITTMPSEWDKTIKDIMDGSPLPPVLPSNLNGPYLSLLNGSSVPDGMLPSDMTDLINNIKDGSPLPADAADRKEELENILAGSPMPTRRMPSFPGMPSIDMRMYEDMLQQIFDSMRGLFDGIELPTKDLAAALRDQGFEMPSIDPTLLLANRDEYLAKLRQQFQHLADKLRSDEVRNIREELSDMIRNRENFNMSMANDYLNKLGGLADPTGRLNSTLGSTLNNISMNAVHDSLRRIGSLVSQQSEEKFEKITSDFQFVASKMRERTETFLEANGSSVRLPPLPLLNQSVSIIQWSGNPYSGVLTSRGINSSVVSVMLSDLSSGNETVVRGLEDLINITLPILGGADGKPECVYWNTSVSDWLGDGCRVQEVLQGAVICGCNHLTDFAVAFSPVVIAVSPSVSPIVMAVASPNPRPSPPTILLVGAGVPVVETSKDMRPLIGGVVGGVAGSVLLSIVAANLWDRRKKARLVRKSILVKQMKNPVVVTMV